MSIKCYYFYLSFWSSHRLNTRPTWLLPGYPNRVYGTRSSSSKQWFPVGQDLRLAGLGNVGRPRSLQWWSDGDFWTDLPRVTQDILAVPATSVPIERLFSINWILSENKRWNTWELGESCATTQGQSPSLVFGHYCLISIKLFPIIHTFIVQVAQSNLYTQWYLVLLTQE